MGDPPFETGIDIKTSRCVPSETLVGGLGVEGTLAKISATESL